MLRYVLGALALAGALGASGCGGGGGEAEPARPEPVRSAPASTAPADAVGTVATEAAPAPADDLDTVRTVAASDGVATVSASAPPVDLEVELLEVLDPAPATDEFSPQRDNRFVAVQVALTNLGTTAYTDTPTSGASIVDADGRPHPAAVLHAAEPSLERVTIAPGETASGFVTFELPLGARAVELHIRLNSGFGPEVGVWRLP
ncbi:MAG TPA: DUF4352 domain-containing protein [Gaiellaceae bacterium]|nr:DUF4352 domain-containing protein [Gaiellaceae bacterium]